jgi:uncharacterized protein involved in high-affinity Fe2+ transport
MVMKILFAMILLMATVTYGCVTDDLPVLEQTASDVAEVGEITVEDVVEVGEITVEDVVETDTEVSPSDVQVSLDASDIVSTVEVERQN